LAPVLGHYYNNGHGGRGGYVDVGVGMSVLTIRMLGPLTVEAGETSVALGGQLQRTVLALLAAEAPETVAAERLMDAVWGDRAVHRARTTLQVYVSNLRRALDAALGGQATLIETAAPGYRLRLEDGVDLDVREFESGCRDGMAALDRGASSQGAELLRRSLALWRGPYLADLAVNDTLAFEAIRLQELREAAIEARVDADLATGRHQELVPELERLVLEYPLRERLWGQLMLALYRAGRQADALRAFRRARTRIADDTGLDPGPDLRRLEASILNQSPRLAATNAHGPHLLCLDDGRVIRRFPLDRQGWRLTVGRSPDCDVAITWDAEVSRRHAVLEHRDGSWSVEDPAQSLNGTLVNGRRVHTRTRLHHGDHLRFGRTILVLQLEDVAPPQLSETTVVARGHS